MGKKRWLSIFILFFKLLMGFLSAIWYVRNTNENINSIFLILLLFPPEITSEIWPSHFSSVKSWWNIFFVSFFVAFFNFWISAIQNNGQTKRRSRYDQHHNYYIKLEIIGITCFFQKKDVIPIISLTLYRPS